MPKKRNRRFPKSELCSKQSYGIYGHCSWRTGLRTIIFDCVSKQDIFRRQISSEYKASQSPVVNIALRAHLLSIPTSIFDWNECADKMTTAFFSADIPLYKLNNPDLQALFKYVGQKALSESAC